MDWHDFVAKAVRRHKHKTAVIASLVRREGEREAESDPVETASRDSFPASDAPGWITLSVGGSRRRARKQS